MHFVLNIGVLNFGFVSDFDIRISCFEFPRCARWSCGMYRGYTVGTEFTRKVTKSAHRRICWKAEPQKVIAL